LWYSEWRGLAPVMRKVINTDELDG
jgi:hypothetical protein